LELPFTRESIKDLTTCPASDHASNQKTDDSDVYGNYGHFKVKTPVLYTCFKISVGAGKLSTESEVIQTGNQTKPVTATSIYNNPDTDRLIIIIIIIIIIITRQFIRRRNMSIKSLQGRHTTQDTRN